LQKSSFQTLRSLVSDSTVAVASREANNARARVASLVTDGAVGAVGIVVVVVVDATVADNNGWRGWVHIDHFIGMTSGAAATQHNTHNDDQDEDNDCVAIYSKVGSAVGFHRRVA
jgi:hypothetical protein